MRLIDADALMEEVNIEIREYMLTEKGMRSLIRNAPTIDAVEVVRCKDCIHFDGFDCNRFGEPAECNSPYSDDGNDFCSYGERKDERSRR